MIPPVALNRSDAPSYWLLGILWTILTDGDDTEGRWSCMEQLMPENSGPPPHIHPHNDEWFYVLDGAMTMNISGQTIEATRGGSVFVPRGNVHSFKVHEGNCHVLNVFTPAGMEKVIKTLGTPASSPVLPPNHLQEDGRTLALFANNYWGMEADVPFATASFGGRAPDGSRE